jgi:hypothetical protein
MRSLLTLSALAALMLFVSAVDAAKPDKGKKKKKKADNVLVAELQHAHKVLKAADPIYKGHRAKALHQINLAIGDLQKEMHKRGLKAHTGRVGDVPVSVSNADVVEAVKEVATVQKQLAALATTPLRTAASNHLITAVKEMETALAVVKKVD